MSTSTTSTATVLFEGPDGWWLDPDGAAVHLDEATAVVADVHLGYEWARASDGDCVPEHSLRETLERLGRVLGRDPARVKRLVVAGDLLESPRPCARAMHDLEKMRAWLHDRGVEFVPLLGNHDPPWLAHRKRSLTVRGWTVVHGDRPTRGKRTVSGHHHPVLRVAGVSAPCFVVGPDTIVLPAFSRNAAGASVMATPFPARVDAESLRCLASAGDELLDFGPLAGPRSALRGL